MIRPRRALSWNPRRRGSTYCAPACGRGCTVEEHERARTFAAALVLRLGKGWRARVWENLGWHWAAVSKCGRLKVHPVLDDKPSAGYIAYLGDADSTGGVWSENGRTPEAAIRNTIEAGRAHVEALAALFVDLPGVRR